DAPPAGAGATFVSCAHCPWRAMNDLRKLVHLRDTGSNEIHVDEAVRVKALRATERMLQFRGD
ncbi:MAG: quinolinate synthase NadA, partial [Pseudomonadota bacterium]